MRELKCQQLGVGVMEEKAVERFFTAQADPPQERREGKCRPTPFDFMTASAAGTR